MAAGNLIPGGYFGRHPRGGLPEGWTLMTPRPVLAPVFHITASRGGRALAAAGNGREDCVGHVSVPVAIPAGRWYRLAARFRMSSGLNPHRSLLFCIYGKDFNEGIFRFRRLAGGAVHGEGRFLVSGKGTFEGDVRIYFRHSAHGRAWIESVTLEECDPVPPRLVRVACTNGSCPLDRWGLVVDAAAAAGADLVLLPEMINGETPEGARGKTPTLLATKAREHGIYLAGGFYHHECATDTLTNTALLFDRKGRQAGRYDKNHPYSPEVLKLGVAPGKKAPVFDTPWGRLGLIICYDSWFTDVTELLALRGAEMVLFPNAGYYRSLMPARAADNGVWMVASSLGSGAGIWDTTGAEVTNPDADPTRFPQHPPAFSKVNKLKVGRIEVLLATLDLSRKVSPHNWGGPMMSAPGGRRNRRDQTHLLWREIEREAERWWEEV